MRGCCFGGKNLDTASGVQDLIAIRRSHVHAFIWNAGVNFSFIKMTLEALEFFVGYARYAVRRKYWFFFNNNNNNRAHFELSM